MQVSPEDRLGHSELVLQFVLKASLALLPQAVSFGVLKWKDCFRFVESRYTYRRVLSAGRRDDFVTGHIWTLIGTFLIFGFLVDDRFTLKSFLSHLQFEVNTRLFLGLIFVVWFLLWLFCAMNLVFWKKGESHFKFWRLQVRKSWVINGLGALVLCISTGLGLIGG